MKNNKNNLVFFLRILISALFILSAFAKLYPTPLYGITKVFEQGQLIPMGFSAELASYFSRFIDQLRLFLFGLAFFFFGLFSLFNCHG